MQADLHVHTTASDGTLSPQEVLDLAAEAGLVLAVTDHEGVAGALAARELCPDSVVIGLELGVDVDGEERHLLIYFPGAPSPAFVGLLEQLRLGRRERLLKMLEALSAAGIHLSEEDFGNLPAVGRPHVARQLVAQGQAGSVKDAFNRYLVPGKPGYVKRALPTVDEALALCHKEGALAALAHPKEYSGTDVAALKRKGLVGIEVAHPSASPRDQLQLRQVAAELSLLVTGGSDFHDPQRGRLGLCGLERKEFLTFLQALGDPVLGANFLPRWI